MAMPSGRWRGTPHLALMCPHPRVRQARAADLATVPGNVTALGSVLREAAAAGLRLPDDAIAADKAAKALLWLLPSFDWGSEEGHAILYRLLQAHWQRHGRQWA
jgi:hypothetical protein